MLRAFAISLTLAAPFVIGAPALTLGGLVLLVITASIMPSIWLPAFLAVLSNPVAP